MNNNIIIETFNLNDYIPKRFALKYNPPQIIIEYLKPSKNKFYHHRMILHKLNKDKNSEDIFIELYNNKRHKNYLDNKKANPNQIIKLIEKIKMNYLSNNNKDKDNENDNINNKNKNNNSNQIVIPSFVEDKNIDFNNDNKNFFEEEYNDFEEDIIEENKNNNNKNNNFIGFDYNKDLNHETYENEWNEDSY